NARWASSITRIVYGRVCLYPRDFAGCDPIIERTSRISGRREPRMPNESRRFSRKPSTVRCATTPISPPPRRADGDDGVRVRGLRTRQRIPVGEVRAYPQGPPRGDRGAEG